MSKSQVSQATLKSLDGYVQASERATQTLADLQKCVRNDTLRLGVTLEVMGKGFKMPAKAQEKVQAYVSDFAAAVATVYTARYGIPMVAYNTRKGGVAIKPVDLPKKGEDGYDEGLAQMRAATMTLTRIFTFGGGEDKRTEAEKAAAFVKRFNEALEKMSAAERRLVKAQIHAIIG